MTQLKIGELINQPTTLANEGSSIDIHVLAETLNLTIYNDITSNVNWDIIGNNLTDFKSCRAQITIYTNSVGFGNLSIEDKKIASKYFIISKTDRDTVHTNDEQKENAIWLLTKLDSYHIVSDYQFNAETIYSANTISNTSYKEIKLFPLKFKLTGRNIDPRNLDYDVYGLQKKRIITKGELLRVEYYKTFTPSANTFSDLILIEERKYTRDALGLIQNRVQTTNWLFEDETTGTTNTTYKFYSAVESIDEGITRRKNIIAEAKVYALTSIGQMTGFDLMTSVKTQIELYIDGYRQPLIDGINLSNKPYMGTKQVEGVSASTIVDMVASQIDSVTINGVELVYTSSTAPTKAEIVSGLVTLITGSSVLSVSKYVTASINPDTESFNITSKIPGVSFTISVTSNLYNTQVTTNNRVIKDAMISILTF